MLKSVNESLEKACSPKHTQKRIQEKYSKSVLSRYLKAFDRAYTWLYDNPSFDDYDLMVEGEKLMKDTNDLLKEFVEFRGDFIASDREVAAYCCALGYAGQVIDIDEYVDKLKTAYRKAWENGLISKNEYLKTVYVKTAEMMKALNITD